ncbi:MAG TPA: ATP-binding protein [Terriglobales bacterium]|nr:ATP-binding protein [Terriglobales bacterium]
MPSFRLKTKLVIGITFMVVVIVAVLQAFYLTQIVHQRIRETYNDTQNVAWHIFALGRNALDVDLSNTRVDLSDPVQVIAADKELLQTDTALAALLESVSANEPAIVDAVITDNSGQVVVSSNQAAIGKPAPERDDFSSVNDGGIRKQLDVLYGPPRFYNVRLTFTLRDGSRFGELRVGVSTTLLKYELRDRMRRALISSGLAILICLLISAALSTIALRPLKAISRRLDLISSGQAEPAEAAGRRDEYGVVSTKIERLGRQMRDVKEVFSALKENLDQMMANLQDGVMLFTSDFRAVLVSASAERFVGKPRAEMLGSHATEIFTMDSPLGRALLAGFQTREPILGEEIEVEQGRRLQVALDFIEEHGERIGALLTLRDTESVHRIEDEIELSRRLAAIGRLTSGVAHEVKNPINAIVVHLEVLRQKLKQVDPDTGRHMDVIGSEIQRLDRVVQTLVDFTRPVELRLAEIDLRKLVDEVVILASPAAEQHQISVEREVSPDSLPVRVDTDLVKQAVLNIVINGVQAMPEGGMLAISSRREGDSALIAVRDSGPGIPPEIRDKIFNLYFTTKKGGSGIGLAMAYRVVQLHQGSMEFNSVAGQGTTFFLRFPLVETTTNGEQSRVPSEDSLSKA